MDCSKKDCRNLATWGPVLLLSPPADYKSPPVKMYINLPICDHHKQLAQLDDFMTETGWQKILKVFKQQRLHEPEKALTRLSFVRI